MITEEMAPSDCDASMATEASGAPVTSERKLNPHLQSQLEKPYLARALAVVGPNNPNGSEGHENRGLSVLQQHLAFFDRNNDGIIYPWETYQGMRAVGFGVFLSMLMGVAVNFLLSYKTQPSWIPSPFLSVHIKNVHKLKHGSDLEGYDTEGRFVPYKFDEIFSKYARQYGDALTYKEMFKMLRSNALFLDFFGQFSAFSEWNLLYIVGKDENGLLHRDVVRACYDGSLFETIERNRKASKGFLHRLHFLRRILHRLLRIWCVYDYNHYVKNLKQ